MQKGSMWVFGLCACLLASAGTAQEAWTVQLTSKQAKAHAEQAGRKAVTAFAISPDGAWGRSHGFQDADQAAKRAMSFCQGELRPRKRDCILFEVAGKRAAPQVVQTRKVSTVYQPLNGRKAAFVFGRAALDFRGNKDGAMAQLATAPTQPSALAQDKKLRAGLTNRTIMTTQAKGFGLWLGDVYAEHLVSTNNGVLVVGFDSWAVTAQGLLCMFNGFWDSGKPVGTKCVLLNSIGNGLVDLSWDGSPNASRKGQLIAGDARFSAAK
ncbi:MAG: hypothetical protein ABJF86_17625 [Tateyamaria sp.]|uniref:hypothetical protein n=1 Tax=Tateyamaria sp. TaxID=1929288 RepID=UPI003271FDBE